MIFNKKRFKRELQIKGYTNSSIQTYIRGIDSFEEWIKQEKTNGNESNTKLAFNYLKFIKKKSNNYSTIYLGIQPLKLYFKFFKKNNPFQFLLIKKVEAKIISKFFDKDYLEGVYDIFPQNTITEIRDKVLLGLYVFQGVKSSEAKTIELTDLDMSEYKLLLRGNNLTNQRKIRLNIKQILLLSEYLNIRNKKLLKNYKTSKLIVVSDSKFAVQNLLQRVSEKLRKDNSEFEALYQIRASVIHNWVKEHGLRKAQYLSGHKYISTTEKFIVKDLSVLQKEVDKFFPF